MAALGLFVVLVNMMVAVVVAALAGGLVLLHRRIDNHRYDHLEIWARRRGLLRQPVWSLCERDDKHEEFIRS